jgi:hypothetical protein
MRSGAGPADSRHFGYSVVETAGLGRYDASDSPPARPVAGGPDPSPGVLAVAKKKSHPLSTHPLRVCVDRVVPSHYQPARAAAERAALQSATHPAALAAARALVPAGVISPARMAILNLKKWQNGQTVRCRVLDGSPAQRKKVEAKAHIWEDYANIAFTFGDDADAEIRISFSADPGSWSAIGTDALVESYFPKYQPTMNYGWLQDDTEDEEYERVVVHEFGHALGCIHEHQNPKAKMKWNRAAVYKTFSGPPNYWSKADIDSNILQKYSPQGISATAFDDASIMLYQFDGALFTDGKGTPLNTELSEHDKQFIAQMYPKSS